MNSIGLAAPITTSGNKIIQSFPVTTNIDLTNLFPYVVSLYANPSEFELEYNSDLNKFDDKIIDLVAESTIPIKSSETKHKSFTYDLALLSNESQCRSSISRDSELTDFINLYLFGSNLSTSGEELTVTNPARNVWFNSKSEDDYETGYLNLKLTQPVPFSENILDTRFCSGEVIMQVSLSL